MTRGDREESWEGGGGSAGGGGGDGEDGGGGWGAGHIHRGLGSK